MKMDALQLSEHIIRYASNHGKIVTNLKLQKTLYYVQGYTLRVYPEAAFDDAIYNWQYGPVVPRVYFVYSPYGSDPLMPDENMVLPHLSSKIIQLFDYVIDACLNISARQLVEKTHKEEPWAETKRNELISQDAMTRFFCSHDPLWLGGSLNG